MDIYAELQVLLECLRAEEARTAALRRIFLETMESREWRDGYQYNMGLSVAYGYAADQLGALIHQASRTDPRDTPEDAAELKW